MSEEKLANEEVNVNEFIKKIKEKVPDVHIYNSFLVAKAKIPQGAKAFDNFPLTLSLLLGTHTIENTSIAIPGYTALILSDINYSKSNVPGALWIYKNVFKLLQSVSLLNSKFTTFLLQSQEVLNINFSPFEDVNEDKEVFIVFDVIIVDFAYVKMSPTTVTNIIHALA